MLSLLAPPTPKMCLHFGNSEPWMQSLDHHSPWSQIIVCWGGLQTNIMWLKKNDVVKHLLRSNLHQKQYVDQVQKVLKKLTIEGGLQADHVELLCNLTDKVQR